MKKQLFKTLKKSASSSTSYSSSESGFSLVELAVIVVMIGIFSAIAAPVWDVFVSRQRVGAVNGQVLQALQSAQAEAKRTKQEITVTFDESVDPPEYQIGNQPQEYLNINGEVPVGKIQIYVQANGDAAVNAITFNHLGAVKTPDPLNNNGQNTDGFTVTVSTQDDGLRQCVKVVTILGAMITSEGDDNKTGCPPN